MAGGIFFSFDGIDGAGKSTQVIRFREWLSQSGCDVVACRDPGSTRLGESVRNILLDGHDLEISRTSEMLLYMAARAQMVDQVIRPALEQGRIVVSDRYLLANVAYQAYAGGLDIEDTWKVGQVATSGIQPDMTFILDLDVQSAWGRLQRAHDRMESNGQDFLERVRNGFLAEARRRPNQLLVINAARDPDSVQSDIRAAAGRLLASRGISLAVVKENS